MDKGSSVTVILLTNNEIHFYPKRNLKKYLTLFTVIYFCVFLFSYWFAKRAVSDPEVASFLVSNILMAAVSFLVWSGESVHSNLHFPAKIDKDGKTREDKVKEFWEKVLSSQNEIKIERVNVQTEDYMQIQILERKIEVSKSVKMIWRDMVLFERNNEGNVSRLEGMPSILMLRE